MPAVIIVDAFWGDSGKGKTAAHLSRRLDASFAVRAGVGTNAGASFTLDDGTVAKHRQLPTAWVNPRTVLAVGPGVLVDPSILHDEVERFGVADRVLVDGRCGLITPEDIEEDRGDEFLRDVVATSGAGVGPARTRFISRKGRQAKDEPTLSRYCGDVAVEVNRRAAAGETVLIGGAQGTQLSVSFSDEYPCTTVKNCTTAAAIDDVGLNWRLLTDVVMVVKAMPTRVGNGPLPHEMTAAEAVERGIAEYGVNTGRMRRKASKIDTALLEYATMLNGPTQIALTFIDHYDPVMKGSRDAGTVTDRVKQLIAEVEDTTQATVTMLDTGPLLSDVIDL